MYLNESVPTEYKGPLGSMSQFACTVGIMIPALLGLGIPNEINDENADSFAIQEYWRVIWLLPIAFQILQVTLMLLVFPYSTPVELKQAGAHEKLMEFMNKLYEKEVVNQRIAAIKTNEGSDNKAEATYAETFCDPRYSRAAWVASAMSMFQQLSGINAIIFYSSAIFDSAGVSPNVGSAIVMTANCFAVIGGAALLTCFGRRTIMLVCTTIMTAILVIMGVSFIQQWNTIMLLFTILFVIVFECSSGPIVWLYMSEITNAKGVSVGSFVNWTFTLIVGSVTSYMI